VHNRSPGVVSAVTVCALTLVLTSGNVTPTSSTSTVAYSLVRSACTSQPVSGLTGTATVCADETETHLSYQNISKFGVLHVYPTSGSPQIGLASEGEQTPSSIIARQVAASLDISRRTVLFPGQNIDITKDRSTDIVEIKLDSVATSGFYAASSLAYAVVKLVGGGLDELARPVQFCAGDVATLFNNQGQQGKQTAVADVIASELAKGIPCALLVKEVLKQIQARRANKETSKDQVTKGLTDNVREYALKTKMDYHQVIERDPIGGARMDQKTIEKAADEKAIEKATAKGKSLKKIITHFR
jgi:hypothetical protein